MGEIEVETMHDPSQLGPRVSPVEFESEGVTCVGDWYRAPPEAGSRGDRKTPLLLMAHGLGGVRDARLPAYAKRFVAAGFDAFVFDYRGFGGSEGNPRELVSIDGQLRDWKAALDCVRRLPEIDTTRIGLWGTSLSGGHVVSVAARDDRVAAVSAQCPMLDGRAAALMVIRDQGVRHGLRISLEGVRDHARSALGLGSNYIALVGAPGELAAMATKDAIEGYEAIMPGATNRRISARIAVDIMSYRPISSAHRLRCPTLIQICEHDTVASPSAAERCARRIGKLATVVRYPIGHFDIYVGDAFERSVRDQLSFFRRHLLR